MLAIAPAPASPTTLVTQSLQMAPSLPLGPTQAAGSQAIFPPTVAEDALKAIQNSGEYTMATVMQMLQLQMAAQQAKDEQHRLAMMQQNNHMVQLMQTFGSALAKPAATEGNGTGGAAASSEPGQQEFAHQKGKGKGKSNLGIDGKRKALSAEHVKKLYKVGSDFYKKAKRRISTAETVGKFNAQLDVYKQEGLKYPAGCKAFSYPKELESLKEELTETKSVEYRAEVIIPKGTLRKDAMRLWHHTAQKWHAAMMLEATREEAAATVSANTKSVFMSAALKCKDPVDEPEEDLTKMDGPVGPTFDAPAKNANWCGGHRSSEGES